jgi:hypothetical protein
MDLAVGNGYSQTISILRNTATSGTIAASSFATPITISGIANPIDLAIFDVDGDGRPEIFATQYASTIIYLIQNFSTPGSLTTSSFSSNPVNLTTATQPYSFAIGDFDNDGKTDFAVAGQSSNTLSLFRNISSPGLISLDVYVAWI